MIYRLTISLLLISSLSYSQTSEEAIKAGANPWGWNYDNVIKNFTKLKKDIIADAKKLERNDLSKSEVDELKSKFRISGSYYRKLKLVKALAERDKAGVFKPKNGFVKQFKDLEEYIIELADKSFRRSKLLSICTNKDESQLRSIKAMFTDNSQVSSWIEVDNTLLSESDGLKFKNCYSDEVPESVRKQHVNIGVMDEGGELKVTKVNSQKYDNSGVEKTALPKECQFMFDYGINRKTGRVKACSCKASTNGFDCTPVEKVGGSDDESSETPIGIIRKK